MPLLRVYSIVGFKKRKEKSTPHSNDTFICIAVTEHNPVCDGE